MTDDPPVTPDPSTGSGTVSTHASTAATDVARRLEAILLIVEEPQSLVSLATAAAVCLYATATAQHPG